jgi:hypothetical protein
MIYHTGPLHIEELLDLALFDVLESVVIAPCPVIAADTQGFEAAPDAGKPGQVAVVLGFGPYDRADNKQKAQKQDLITSFHFLISFQTDVLSQKN